MRAVEVIGIVDAQHQIQATVPAEVPQGPVRLIVLIPAEGTNTTDALTAAVDAVCAEVDTRLVVSHTEFGGSISVMPA